MEKVTWKEFREHFMCDELDKEAFDIAECPNDDTPILSFALFSGEEEDGDEVMPRYRRVPKKGWAAFLYEEDFSFALFKDSKPILGIYISTRGKYYQAGLYIHDGEQYAHATNLEDGFETWMLSNKDDIDADVAKDFLLGTGIFRNKEKR